jgi:hypothetical protein
LHCAPNHVAGYTDRSGITVVEQIHCGNDRIDDVWITPMSRDGVPVGHRPEEYVRNSPVWRRAEIVVGHQIIEVVSV